jgi:hypothetical protein
VSNGVNPLPYVLLSLRNDTRDTLRLVNDRRGQVQVECLAVPLSGEDALAACAAAVPESIGVGRRAHPQAVEPRYGRVWRVRCRLRDRGPADAVIDAISGRVLAFEDPRAGD